MTSTAGDFRDEGLARAGLFRVLGDEDRLRLFALCAEEELTVGELALLVKEGQPQTSRKAAVLREAGLLLARREGARTFLRAAPVEDPVIAAALAEGRALAARAGQLARIPLVVRAREEHGRAMFDQEQGTGDRAQETDTPFGLLSLLAPLVPARRLAVDVGVGDGALMPFLSPLFERVIGVDRSSARLAQCAARVASLGLTNVRLLEGDAQDPHVVEEIARQPSRGADAVVCARVLHHASRPQETVAASARLLAPGGTLLVVDYLPHSDDVMRSEHGDVWLGFAPDKLRGWFNEANLPTAGHAILAPAPHGFFDSHLTWQLAWALKPKVNDSGA